MIESFCKKLKLKQMAQFVPFVLNIHFHTLRHTFATQAIEKGINPKTVSELLGHASVSITLDRYVHPSEEEKRKCMNIYSSLVKNK